MGLFRRREPPVERSPARDESVKSEFATSADVVEEAFDHIMADVDAPAEAKRRLRPLFVEAHRSGHPRREIEAIETAFEGIEWGEAYFGTWRERFAAEGSFPYMWQKAGRALCTEPPPVPTTIDEAVAYLSVADMRRLLIDLGTMPDRARPKKRAEFEELLAASGATDEVVAATRQQHEAAVEEHMAQREVAKCELLAHTLSKQAYALRDRCNQSRKVEAKKIRPLQTDCPVEAAYASRFMAGELAGDPPFFPGDRTSFVVDFDD